VALEWQYTNQSLNGYDQHCLLHGSWPCVKIKFKDFSRTFKDHTKDIYAELN